MFKQHQELWIVGGLVAAYLLLKPKVSHNLPSGSGATKAGEAKNGSPDPAGFSGKDAAALVTSLGSIFKSFQSPAPGDKSSAANDSSDTIDAPVLM